MCYTQGEFLPREGHQALANVCKADAPVRKRRIVAVQSLVDNKGSGGAGIQPVLCPMRKEYLKMSLDLRNSSNELGYWQ